MVDVVKTIMLENNYTYGNIQGSSAINYLLCRKDIMNHVLNFEVKDPNILSDHCCVTFSLKSCNVSVNKDKVEICCTCENGKTEKRNVY